VRRRDLLPGEQTADWAEWQAGYAGGALLMPESFARRAVAAFFRDGTEEPPAAKKFRRCGNALPAYRAHL
jgi:hypothetical protein